MEATSKLGARCTKTDALCHTTRVVPRQSSTMAGGEGQASRRAGRRLRRGRRQGQERASDQREGADNLRANGEDAGQHQEAGNGSLQGNNTREEEAHEQSRQRSGEEAGTRPDEVTGEGSNVDLSAAPRQHLKRSPAANMPDPDVPHAVELRHNLLIGRGSGLQGVDENGYALLACGRVPLMISRQHAKIQFDGQAWTIYDFGSRNGTYINSMQLRPREPCKLTEGMVVSFGGPSYVSIDGARAVNPFVFTVRDGPPPPPPQSLEFPEIRKAKAEPLHNDLQCGICLNVLNAPRTLSVCGHSFCGDCLYRWLMRCCASPTCPICRNGAGPAPNPHVSMCRALESMVHQYEENNMCQDEIDERSKRESAVRDYESKTFEPLVESNKRPRLQ